MKKLLLILLSTMLLVNCKDDDESNGNNNGDGNGNNKMTYLGEDIPLNGVEFYNVQGEGVILYIHDGSAYYNGAQVNFAESYFDDLGGTYTFNVNDQTYDPNSNFWAGSITNFDSDVIYEEITDGQITVQVNGNTISVDFELETAMGVATGHYEGGYTERL